MNNGTRVTRRLRRAWPPKARTAAALIATASLALGSAAYGSRPSSISVDGSSRARESAYSQSTHNKAPPSSGNETPRQAAQDYAQLLGWAKCMRHRGYPKLPNPKRGTPQPMGGHGGAVLGWGAAYIEVPEAYDVFSQAFQNKAKTCGFNPVTGNPRH
jgi:hypothetical protein